MAIINDPNSTQLVKDFCGDPYQDSGKICASFGVIWKPGKREKTNFNLVYFFRDFKRYWISEKPLKVITINARGLSAESKVPNFKMPWRQI